eukprot:gnl/MRDRNA2_/MRDRNA2_136146_c0_seq1.p1 gnl/MRDRNA2_/MRDRNA2_136146_c0~~gnl/MRDRNA2_/MRDRNA2_136146_c0_seq1.p1  ORF type:complete len:343 (-),score=56.69 gnl/MRDRNA2_/MRDRNA2_136146_c0_seq1:49-1077(-)
MIRASALGSKSSLHMVYRCRASLHMSQQQSRGVRVLAIGNTIIDNVLTMPSMPVDDKVWIDSKKKYIGGQGMNCAQDMAQLGLDVSVLTRIGDDDEGENAIRQFLKLGINVDHCISVPKAFTMSAYVAIETETSRRTCLMHKDESMFEYDVTSRVQDAVQMVEAGRYDAVYTDGHQLELVLPVAHAAVRKGLPLLSDAEVLDDKTRELAQLATELVAPATIICTLSGLSDPAKAVLALADRVGKTVVATAGAEGSYAARYGDVEACFMPAWSECKPIDTVGAGDAYHAGFMAATHRGYADLRECMLFATRVAAALCETPGPVVSPENLERYGLLPETERSAG